MINLSGKTAVITGASRGLGRKIANDLAKYGVNIVLNYVEHKSETENIVNEILLNGGNAYAVKCNLSCLDEVEAFFDAAIKHFGKVDILINNSSYVVEKALKNVDETGFDYIYNRDVKSVFFTMKVAADKLEFKGRIINITSALSQYVIPHFAICSSAKAAVEQMSKVFAKEVESRGITVNCVIPGPKNLDLYLKLRSKNLVDRFARLMNYNNFGDSDETCGVVFFLCSDDSQWISGDSIRTNGGIFEEVAK